MAPTASVKAFNTNAPLPARHMQSLQNAVIVVAVHLAAIAAWQAGTVLFKIPQYILPSPLEMVSTLSSPNYDWIANTLVTATEIFGGYVAGVVGGVGLAMLFAWSPVIGIIVMPLLVTLNMVPKVALGPLFVAWFSFGIFPNILIVFSITFFPILLTATRGMKEIDPDLMSLVRSLSGSRWQLFSKIQLPGSLPYIFSGMKVSAILAVAGAVVGEFIASEHGLGFLMIQVQSSLDTAAMLMAVALLSALGMALYGCVWFVEAMVTVQDDRAR